MVYHQAFLSMRCSTPFNCTECVTIQKSSTDAHVCGIQSEHGAPATRKHNIRFPLNVVFIETRFAFYYWLLSRIDQVNRLDERCGLGQPITVREILANISNRGLWSSAKELWIARTKEEEEFSISRQ